MAKENKAKKAAEKIGKVKFITEFKAFISRGNVLDMAVGMIVGSAFTAIITALVNKVLMPALGMLTGGIDFKDLKIILKEAVLNAEDPTIIDVPEVAIAYGEFIAAIINFFLIAISVFILIKVIGSFKRKKVEEPKPAEEPKPDPQIELLTEIRDLLKAEKVVVEEAEAETV